MPKKNVGTALIVGMSNLHAAQKARHLSQKA
jgi:hypothetical protein